MAGNAGGPPPGVGVRGWQVEPAQARGVGEDSACLAAACVPRRVLEAPVGTLPQSARTTTSGSSAATSASRSPLRAAARKAWTTLRSRSEPVTLNEGQLPSQGTYSEAS
jgi:hypothetical protein